MKIYLLKNVFLVNYLLVKDVMKVEIAWNVLIAK